MKALPRVLFLRPFIPGSESRAKLLEKLLGPALRKSKGWSENPDIQAVIDEASPRLAGQRLYEAIRHWQICLVDLTWWRANVLFELGIRLAVQDQSQQTICLLDETEKTEAGHQAVTAVLKRLLNPFPYNTKHTIALSGAVERKAPAYIYQTALRHFRTRQDYVDQQVDEFLDAAAPSKSDNPQQNIDLRQLYARNNSEYSDELNETNVEMRCAAWYYLAEREQTHRMRPIDLLDPSRLSQFRPLQETGNMAQGQTRTSSAR
jgi:hypothetical protein